MCVIVAILTALEHKAALATNSNTRAPQNPPGRNQSRKGNLSCQHQALPGSPRSAGMEPFLSICQEGDLAFLFSSAAGMVLKSMQQVDEVGDWPSS